MDESILAREIDRPHCKFISMESMEDETQQDSIYNLNIRGVFNNLANLEEFLGQIDHKEHVKAITLTEVVNADHTEKNYFVDSHTLLSACRENNKNRGSVGILVLDSLQSTVPNISHNYLADIFESITVIIKDIKAIIAPIYRPNGCANSCPKEFNKFLSLFLQDLSHCYQPIYSQFF